MNDELYKMNDKVINSIISNIGVGFVNGNLFMKTCLLNMAINAIDNAIIFTDAQYMNILNILNKSNYGR